MRDVMRLAMVVGLSAGLAAGSARAQDIVREGGGERREKLAKMELKPFPAEAWNGLDAWINGQGSEVRDIGGRPVLIVTFASWYPISLRALPLAQQLADKYASQGLIVIGLHHERGWENAEALVKQRKITFPIARDTGSAWRGAMLSDQDPDFYVIDRAGQLRFADIDTGSVESAVKIVVEETPDQAGGINDRLAADRAQAQRDARRVENINSSVDFTRLPPIPFTPPSEDQYKNAAWPNPPKGDENRSYRDGPREPQKYAAHAAIMAAAKGRPGQALIVYGFNPEQQRTVEYVTSMDLLQKQMVRDVRVAGLLVPLQDNNNRRDDEEAKKLAASIPEKIAGLKQSFRLSHELIPDVDAAALTAANPDNERNRSNESYIPFAAVISSDGIIRWWGHPGDHAFRAAVDKVLKVDPGIRARRQAEDEYIRRHGG
ncbi:MAG: TlpA disulfide reductase family protein [Phycisphaerales bacterium]|jgi:thiol-disulfide isomerase/thioredoxin|nr:TlpA disulfide reductase family protein [Phycisphaerales bacterium]